MLHGHPPPRRILADNLSILGFSPSNHNNNNNPHYSGVNLTEDAFAGANNTKAFELISWFLFTKLDAHKARKLFAHCWPIVDYRSQPREYRSVAFKWLEELKKENKLFGDTVLRRSYLEDCRGERIEKIMASFSTLALKTVMERTQRESYGLLPININDRSMKQISLMQTEIKRLDRIIADTESERDMAKKDWESREDQIGEQLQRLDKYQKQMQAEQRREATTSSLLRHLMSDNIPMNQLEKYYLKRLDSLDSLWHESLDVLMFPRSDVEAAHGELHEDDFRLDNLTEMWLQAEQALNSVKNEALGDRKFESRSRVMVWAKQQAANYSRRALKAQALKNRLCRNRSCHALDNTDGSNSVIGAKRILDETSLSLPHTVLQMPSLKRARSSASRIQDIRDLVSKCVEEKRQENEMRLIHAGRSKQRNQRSHITTELPKISTDLMLEETEMEGNILSPVAKVAKAEVLYDRNGRRIRRASEDQAQVLPHKEASLGQQHSKKRNKPKSTVVATTKSDRLFKENRIGKVDATLLNKKGNTPIALTPMEIAHEKILEQMNNPPSSMITPPRAHITSKTAHYNSSSFESPSFKKFSIYQKKLAEAADMEPAHNDMPSSLASKQQDHLLDGDEEDIFQDLPFNVAQSTPQRPMARDIRGDLEPSMLSTVSPANTSLIAYNAVIDEASVYLFGENMPDNFDEGGEITI